MEKLDRLSKKAQILSQTWAQSSEPQPSRHVEQEKRTPTSKLTGGAEKLLAGGVCEQPGIRSRSGVMLWSTLSLHIVIVLFAPFSTETPISQRCVLRWRRQVQVRVRLSRSASPHLPLLFQSSVSVSRCLAVVDRLAVFEEDFTLLLFGFAMWWCRWFVELKTRWCMVREKLHDGCESL